MFDKVDNHMQILMFIFGDHHDDDNDNDDDDDDDADEDDVGKNHVRFFIYCFVCSFLHASKLSTMNLTCQDLINISNQ